MGANTFYNTSTNPNADAAFRELTESSRFQSGHQYSGEIGMKHEFVVIQRTPLAPEAAAALADQLIDNADARVDDKFGPAGAIPLSTNGKTVEGWAFFGWASS